MEGEEEYNSIGVDHPLAREHTRSRCSHHYHQDDFFVIFMQSHHYQQQDNFIVIFMQSHHYHQDDFIVIFMQSHHYHQQDDF